MSDKYILNDKGEPVPAPDLLTWARWWETTDRSLASTECGDVRVSTVFLSIDHNFSGGGPPLLWETLVFGGSLDGEMYRYATRLQAQRGHEAMVAQVRLALQVNEAHAPGTRKIDLDDEA